MSTLPEPTSLISNIQKLNVAEEIAEGRGELRGEIRRQEDGEQGQRQVDQWEDREQRIEGNAARNDAHIRPEQADDGPPCGLQNVGTPVNLHAEAFLPCVRVARKGRWVGLPNC